MMPGAGRACFKKNGTEAAAHWSRSARYQSGCVGRAPGPLSQPEIIQLSD